MAAMDPIAVQKTVERIKLRVNSNIISQSLFNGLDLFERHLMDPAFTCCEGKLDG
jgi:hypothetical protein